MLLYINCNISVCSEAFGKCYSLFAKLTTWKDAGFECWKRNMKLVSVRSRVELRFINYLLREHRYADKQPVATFDSVFRNASYYVHLGAIYLCNNDCNYSNENDKKYLIHNNIYVLFCIFIQ